MLWLKLMAIALTLSLTALSALFGASLAVADLTRRRGYRWFPYAPWVATLVAAGASVGMLALGQAPLHLMWLSILAGWLVRGRAFGLDRLVVIAAMAGYLVTRWPIVAVDPWALPFFALPMIGIGVLADLAARRGGAWGGLLGRFVEARLHWYGLAAAYCFFFELDPTLCLGVYGFLTGESQVRASAEGGRLASWGLRRVA